MRSLHSTGAMFWGGAAYNNGILDFKQYILGEAYDRNGEAVDAEGPEDSRSPGRRGGDRRHPAAALSAAGVGDRSSPATSSACSSAAAATSRNLFPETGLPNATGQLQRIEEPGRPDFRQSNRGPGTGARIAVPVINITKTRLNDPLTWFIGTNDQPGDYRHSGCASCHVVYANDRDPRHSGVVREVRPRGPHADRRSDDQQDRVGPSAHAHAHALGADQPMHDLPHAPAEHVPEQLPRLHDVGLRVRRAAHVAGEAAVSGRARRSATCSIAIPKARRRAASGRTSDFLKQVSELNPQMKDTQFADYHGHGWNFRAVFKRDRKGNLLDAAGNVVSDDDPQKFKKAVHLSSIHVDVGMQCVDCHFSQDNHGNGYIYGEVAAAVEIDCKDCHGTAQQLPNLYTSGPAALGGGTDMTALRTPDGRRRFEWVGDALVSALDDGSEPRMEDEPRQERGRSGQPRLQREGGARQADEPQHRRRSSGARTSRPSNLAHTRRRTWSATRATRRGRRAARGCHLPIEANAKTERHHYEGGETRNYATYNPQVARDDMFLLGRREPAAGGKIAPVRSTSALVLSSTNSSRERIYVQQPPIAASGYSSQAFNPHYPHTERKTETKTCSDCHLSKDNDNNAIMAQLLALGNELRQLRRLQRVRRRRRRDQRRHGHRVGRAAGRDRQLSAPVRVSGLVRAAREERPTLAARLQPRRRRCALPAVARRVSVRRGRQQRRAGLRRREHRQQGRVAACDHGAVQPARARHAHRLEGRDLRRAADESADPSAAQHRRQDAQGEPGAAVPSDLQLRVHHGCAGRPDPHRREHAGRRRAAQQLPEARADVESERRAERRAPHHGRRLLPVHHDEARPGDRQRRRCRCSRSWSPRCR